MKMKVFCNNFLGWLLFGGLVLFVALVSFFSGKFFSQDELESPCSNDFDSKTGYSRNETLPIYSKKPITSPPNTEYILPYKLNNDGRAPFRSFSSLYWDAHPEYKFVAFEKVFHLILSHPDNHFLTKTLKTVTMTGNNETRSSHLKGLSGCFYQGYVKNDATSSVAVSLCNGMTGHIRTRSGSYFIEPVEKNVSSTSQLQLHAIYGLGVSNTTDDDYVKPYRSSNTNHNTNPNPNANINDNINNLFLGEKHSRRKRSMSSEHYVELMVVTDKTMSEYHGENLRHYVLTLLSIVALVYRDASIGNPINIALVQFVILDNQDFSDVSTTSALQSGTSAGEMLRNFCRWQKEHNHLDDHSRHHHDTALLLTRETICRNPWTQKCDTLGLAELGTMCDHFASCAIVQDNGLSAAFTIAHELGHVMNMPHDEDNKCRSILGDNDSIQQHYVMSRMLDHNTYPWAWSRCSRHFLTEFLDAGHGACLEDEPIANLLVSDEPLTKQPGEIFSEHKQCQLVFGMESQLCSYMPSCRRLWCTTGVDEEESEGCRTQHMPWADGTPCSHDKWCQKGACVPKDLSKLQVRDGGWGEWLPFEPCSRSCGGGIKKSTRECDSPVPSNGGKYCVGPRVRYDSCNTFDCPETKDFRAEQCQQFNNDNFNIHGLPKDIVWEPKYSGISLKDRCKLYCRVSQSSSYYLLRDKVIDGTPCSPDTFDVCVNGFCKPAGCDRVLNSTLKLDACGVCGGDGSTCRMEQGAFNTTSYGYNTVLQIPAGATNIDIRQHSFDNTPRDDNYLALYDPHNNKYILNGDFVVSMFRKTVNLEGSLLLEYSGSDSTIERINSSSRPIPTDIIVQVLSVGKLMPPDIQYNYVINTKSRGFIWSIDYGECSAICQGMMTPTLYCLSKNSSNRVDPSNCNHLPKPETKVSKCNTQCSLRFMRAPPECPACETKRPRCVKIEGNKETELNPTYCRGIPAPEFDTAQCLRSCERKLQWRWTRWGQCSAKCGDGVTRRRVWCQVLQDNVVHFVNDSSCQGNKPDEIRKCNNGPCGKWVVEAWSPCSVTCGEGVTKALYGCYLGESLLPADYCHNSVKPETERPCVTSTPCPLPRIQREQKGKESTYHWKVGPWGQCSSACDARNSGGVRLRQVVCLTENGTLGTACDEDIRPPHSSNCTADVPCPVWVTGKWNNCEKSPKEYKNCTGVKTRTVRCETLNSVLSDAICLRHFTTKPATLSCCEYKEKHKASYKWKVSPWTKCTCGFSVKKKRTVECVHKPSGKLVDESYCESHAYYRGKKKTPKSKRRCERIYCPFVWVSGRWSKCSQSCGYGLEKRSVACHAQNKYGFIDPDPVSSSLCEEKKPKEYNYCFLSSCESKYTWVAPPWPETCPVNCDKRWHRQKRRVRCIEKSTQRRVPNGHCDRKHRPKRKLKCPCVKLQTPSSCKELQQLKGVKRDGNYMLYIGGNEMEIYCYGMGTLEPKEFITLKNSNRDSNFAEVYSKRLIRPWTCPGNGTRLESCDCIEDKSRRAGKSIFAKIRLNVTNLSVIDDWRFALSVDENIPYGTSGDCYSSSMRCPQGQFNIDLRGTGFAVSTLSTWVSHGHKTVMNIHKSHDNEVVRARCGGYCGTCSPRTLKLQVK